MVDEVAESAGGEIKTALMMSSALWRGLVLHSRTEPISHTSKHHARLSIYECSSNSSKKMFLFEILLTMDLSTP